MCPSHVEQKRVKQATLDQPKKITEKRKLPLGLCCPVQRLQEDIKKKLISCINL